MQVELDTHSSLPKGYVYTISDVEKMCKPLPSSNQLSLNGWMFFRYKNLEEVEWVKHAILDALNNPQTFNANDSYGALCNLKEKIKRCNAIVLKEQYDIPVKLEYRSSSGVNCIVDANHNDKVVIPLTAAEILDVIMDFKKNRDYDYIMNSYEFHHRVMNLNKNCLMKFKKLYFNGELNRIITFICKKSNERGGFMDHDIGVIRNRVTSNYLNMEGMK